MAVPPPSNVKCRVVEGLLAGLCTGLTLLVSHQGGLTFSLRLINFIESIKLQTSLNHIHCFSCFPCICQVQSLRCKGGTPQYHFHSVSFRSEQDFNMNYNFQLENNAFVFLKDIVTVSYQKCSNGHYWILGGIYFICKWQKQ